MSKRKATSQGRRRIECMQIDYEDNSSDEEGLIRRVVHAPQEHIHVSFSSASQGLHTSTRTSTFTTPASPSKTPGGWQPLAGDSLLGEDSFFDADDEEVRETGVDPSYQHRIEELGRADKTKSRASHQPMRSWLPLRGNFLDELLRLEGCGTVPPERRSKVSEDDQDPSTRLTCPTCNIKEQSAKFRCRDCFGNDIYCQDCMVLMHGRHPLHRIQVWNEGFFSSWTLQGLGLRIQLGHDGRRCLMPKRADKDFLVIDTLGIQGVSVDFCGCDKAELPYIQILRAEWYPATVINPSTVATIRCLEFFHQTTLQSKISAYDFCSTLERITDNTDLHPPPDRYEELMRMVRQWRHLKQLKRAGRGHIPDGIETTQEGELAIQCPACPHPGINLPTDWKNAAPENKWLYKLLLSLDANFRLRRKNVSSDQADPALADGWSYFVARSKYAEHLAKHPNQKDVSSCSNFAAIGQANSRSNKGLAVTGVGACVCARHQLMRANGVADLHRGERYCNMDYVFLSTLRKAENNDIVISYDVSCQWYKNLQERMNGMSLDMRLNLEEIALRYVVPKFHLSGHVTACHSPFSFNFCEGVGRTDGEGIERNWSVTNPVASSTKEMTPGHRTDTMNDHWGAWNWRQVSGMGRALARKIKAAVPECLKHTDLFQTMSNNLPTDKVDEWTRMVKAWEAEMATRLPRDVEADNPYVVESDEMTQADVRLKLAEDDAKRAASGEVAMHEVTPGQFMIAGLELQEQQQRIKEDRKGLITGTSTQRAGLQERRTNLRRKITAWETIQTVYMPGVLQMRMNSDQPVATGSKPTLYAGEPEERLLFLPSQIPDCNGIILASAPLHPIELQLRQAQAYDSLRDIRHYLRLLAFLWRNKNKNVRGQRENTRSQTLIKRTESKKQASVLKYRRAWRALHTLQPDGPWSASLKELSDSDVRGLTDAVGSETEGRRTVSWIWIVDGTATGPEADDANLHNSLRVEWCKARSRALRWTEEIRLLREEMRRVLAWLEWRTNWWKHHERLRVDMPPELIQGVRAYAARQAKLQQDLLSSFAQRWVVATEWVDAEFAAAEGSKE